MDLIYPLVLKIWNGILNFYDPVRDRYVSGSESDKDQGENPKDPKDPSDSDYYINNKGKKMKRYNKNRTEEQKKRKRELAIENHRKKAEAEGRNITQREYFVGLTEEEKKERRYNKRRENIANKREEDFKKFPVLKDITKRRKNKARTEEEIKEFDQTSIENRKKSMAAYWRANKHKDQLRRPGRIFY
jgi:hypothetical protein